MLPSFWIVYYWTPGYLSVYIPYEPLERAKWTFYIEYWDHLINPSLSALAGLGVVTGLSSPRWRATSTAAAWRN